MQMTGQKAQLSVSQFVIVPSLSAAAAAPTLPIDRCLLKIKYANKRDSVQPLIFMLLFKKKKKGCGGQ